MKLINRLSNTKIKNQFALFQQGETVRNKDIHIENHSGSIIIYEQQITPVLRQFKQRFLKVMY